MSVERYEIKLEGGTVLHQLSNEDTLYGHIAIEADGRARIWRQTWVDRYSPTENVYPGFVSAVRAVLRGEV
jgi:hypothetical protein